MMRWRNCSFNPRTREGCDDRSALGGKACAVFQSTHPRRVRRSNLQYLSWPRTFQSTHPRRVRRQRISVAKIEPWVSIHAPAKGATCIHKTRWTITMFQSTHPRRVRRHFVRNKYSQSGVSIHAPAKGATSMPPTVAPVPFVSIHAPAKGATLKSLITISTIACFNPRTREGCDAVNDFRLVL